MFDKEEFSEDIPVIEQETPKPVLESMVPVAEDIDEKPEVFESRPVLESMTPATETKPETSTDIPPIVNTVPQYSEPVRPVPPVVPVVNNLDTVIVEKNTRSKPTFIYYLLLVVLIALSIFTLWLYQKQMGTNKPLLTSVVEEKVVEEQPAPVVKAEVSTEKPEQVKSDKVKGAEEFVFDDEEEVVEPETTVDSEEVEPVVESEGPEIVAEEPTEVEEVAEEEDDVVEESVEPVVMDAVPASIIPTNNSGDEEMVEDAVEEISVDKPEYNVGSKDNNIIVSEQEYQESVDNQDEEYEEEFYEE